MDDPHNCLIFENFCLRVNVVEGAELSRTLRSGQMNFLTAIGEIQKALFQEKAIDAHSASLAGYYFDFFSAPDIFAGINCFDPWLFAMAQGTREEQEAYYRKVWELHRHFKHHILLTGLGLPMLLMRVISNFSTLQVTVLVRGDDGGEERLMLNRGDEEGSIYTLSFCNGENPSAHPLDPRISGEPSSCPHFSKSSHSKGLEFETHILLISCRLKH